MASRPVGSIPSADRPRPRRDDIVGLQHDHLIARQHRRDAQTRRHLRHAADHLGDGKRQRGQHAVPACFPQDVFQDVLERPDLGSAQLEGAPRRIDPRHRPRDGRGHVADIDRLELRHPAADQRQGGCHRRHLCELVQEIVALAEHDGGPQDHRIRLDLTHRVLGLALGAGIDGLAVRVRSDGRDLDQPPHALFDAGLGHVARAI